MIEIYIHIKKTLFFLALTVNSCVVFANTNSIISACFKAVTVANQSIQSEDQYDQFIAIEGLSNINSNTDTSILIKAIDANAPFVSRAAIASILSIDHPLLSSQLFKLAYEDESIADMVAAELQLYKNSNSIEFIKWYLESFNDRRKLVRGLKAIVRSESSELGYYVKNNYSKFLETKLVELYALLAINKLEIEYPSFQQKILLLSNDDDVYVKEMAAVILGMLDGKRVHERLTVLSSDKEPRVSITAKTSLLQHQKAKDTSKLSNIISMNTLPNSEIAAGSIKRLPKKQAFDVIKSLDIEHLKDGIVIRLLEALASVKGGNASTLLKWALSQKNEDLVIQAIFSIGMRQQENEVKLVEHLLHDSRPAIRSVASWALLVTTCENKYVVTNNK